MNEQYNPKLKTNARALRKNLTKEERHLWYDCFKLLPVTVQRQKAIGPYIVDFYIASARIVIELDGSQHYEENHHQRDTQRDAYLNSLGCQVLRYSNADINDRFAGVCEDIMNHISAKDTNSPKDNR